MFGNRPPPQSKPEPELPHEPERHLTREEELYAHRYMELLECGVEPAQALTLIHIPDIGHRAKDLHHRGCPPHLIVELLT